jgi:hypothetical protein
MVRSRCQCHGSRCQPLPWQSAGRDRFGLPQNARPAAVSEFPAGLDDDDIHADRSRPKVISPADPCSAWTAKANKRVQFGYGLNYLIDIKNAVIVDVEATPARTYDEVKATRTMIERTEYPERLLADTAYGTGKFLEWLVGAGITPHIPVWEKALRGDGTFARSDFTFDKRRTSTGAQTASPCGRPVGFTIAGLSSIGRASATPINAR